MVINATVERRGRVLADRTVDQATPSGVVVHKRRHIIDDPLDQRHGLVLDRCHLLELFEREHGQLVDGCAPHQCRLDPVQLLLLHPDLTFLDLIGRESLQVRGQAQERAEGNQPLGRVVLVKLDRVPIVLRELVVEVVVALTQGHQGRQDVVAGCVAVVKGHVTQPVGQRVDTEGGMMHHKLTDDAAIDESTPVIAPA